MTQASMISAARWLLVTAMLSLLLSLSVFGGCATSERTVVIRPTEDIVHLDAGIPAPYAGWLLTDEQIIEIYDALGRKLEK